MLRTLLFFTLLGAFSGAFAQNNLYFPPKIGTTWQTLSPASLGFCQERIDSLYRFLDDNNTKSFILLKDGKIVLEKYFDSFTQDSLWYWASAGKSATAFLIGQAQEEGLLNINNPSSTYLGAGWTTCPPSKEALITVRNQLTMTNGLDDNIPPSAAVPEPDNCTDPACLLYKADAGTRWAYHNAPYHLLHDVIEAVSGLTIQQFTKTRLLDKTGMKGFWFEHVLYGRARDMARYGLLVLANGVWDGDTLLHDQQYLYDMRHPSQTLNKSYGYLWWLNGQPSFMLPGLQLAIPGTLVAEAPPDMFAALGKNDQKIHIVPSKGWVIVRQGNASNFAGPNGGTVPIYFDNNMWKYLNLLDCSAVPTLEASENQIVQLSPNPAIDQCRLSSQWPMQHIEVLDTDGRLVHTRALAGETQVDLSMNDWPVGMYYLRIRTEQQLIVQKLIKQ
jgi:CubicO group peptidase (beta-lactamase class C family)